MPLQQWRIAAKVSLVTGICECVSAIGPLLGGGHSMLQGRHGFAADNLVSARLVLANGSAVTVSEWQNHDLFWALRGAGHNFGVVTSFDLKVFDVPKESWTMIVFTFTQDKLELFFDTWNHLEAANEQLGLLLLQGVVTRNDSIDLEHVSQTSLLAVYLPATTYLLTHPTAGHQSPAHLRGTQQPGARCLCYSLQGAWAGGRVYRYGYRLGKLV